MEEAKLREEQIESENIFSGVILNVKRDRVRLPNGHSSVREVIRHVGAVCVVPVTDDGRVVLERQYRYPIDQVITEIPAGKLEIGENPDDAIRRELAEEAGLKAESITSLGAFYPTVGYSNEIIRLYLAKGLTYVGAKPDEDEFLEIKYFPIDELRKKCLSGEITDSKTIIAIFKYFIKHFYIEFCASTIKVISIHFESITKR